MIDKQLQHFLKESEKKNSVLTTEMEKLKTSNAELITKNIDIEKRLLGIEEGIK